MVQAKSTSKKAIGPELEALRVEIIGAVNDALSTLNERLPSVCPAHGQLAASIDNIGDSVERATEHMKGKIEDMSRSVEKSVDELRERTEDMAHSLVDLTATMAGMTEHNKAVARRLDTVDRRLNAHHGSIEVLQTTQNRVRGGIRAGYVITAIVVSLIAALGSLAAAAIAIAK